MTYVVVELCVDCKYTDCAAVCPVEAFHELPDRLYINADTCIDCDACVPECPVEAIFADTNVPEHYTHWTQINIDEAPNYPVISQKIPALHGEKCRADRKSTRLNSSHSQISYAVFCLKKKKKKNEKNKSYDNIEATSQHRV